MSGNSQPHYSQGPKPSKPCPNATMDFAPPREDLTSGSVNLITNDAGKRPAILLNIQRGPNAPQRPRPPAPSTTTSAAPPPPLAPPPSQHSNPPNAYPPHGSQYQSGPYPPSNAYQAGGSYTANWGAPHSWGGSAPPWGTPASQNWGAPPAWGQPSANTWGGHSSWAPPPPNGPPSWGAQPTGSWSAPPPTSAPPAPPANPPGPWDFYYGQMQGGQGAAPPLRRTPPPAPPPAPPPEPPTVDTVAPPGEEEVKAVAPPLVAATAVKKKAVIYTTPRPPTPEKPKPIEAMAPHGPVLVPVPDNQSQQNLNEIFNPVPTEPPPPKPVTYMDALVSLEKSMNPTAFPQPAEAEKPKRKQYFHDGEAWVYAYEQPPMKKKPEPVVLEDVVKKAILTNVLENMEKGKYNVTPQFKDGRRGKKKSEAVPIKCEVCKLTVSCQKTFESHLAGRPHQKKMAQVERAKKLEAKIKEDTEMAKNAMPGREGPDNPLESTDDGNIRCKVCDCIMNSGAQAQAHLNGTKHRHRMDKHARGLRGRGRGRGAFRGGHNFRGGFHQASGPGWGSQFVEPEDEPVKDEDEVTTAEAEEEYKRVFAECLENNFDLDLATKTAKAAMRAALNIVDSEDESDENEEEDEYDEEMEDLTRGITVIEPPSEDGGKPGQYRCDLCEPPVQLNSEVELENHVVSEEHKKAGAKLAALTSFPHGGAAEKGKGRGRGRGRGKLDPTRGKVYKGRPNALSSDTMKAQRGRRGLISFGEVMPSKLTKSQKKLAKVKNDISTILAKHKVESALTLPTEEKPKMPMLQAFVKGNEEGELHGSGEVNYAAYQNEHLNG